MDEQTKIAIKEALKESVQESTKDLRDEVKSVSEKSEKIAKDLALIKMAGEIADGSGVSVEAKKALGNTVKSVFGVAVEKDAVLITKDAISGGDANYGGALMGVEVQNGIVRIANNFGLIQKFADIRKTKQRTYKLRFDENELNAGGYDDELATRNGEKVKFTPKEIMVKKWRRFINSSVEAIEDADAVDLGAYILTILAESLALHTDKEGFDTLLGNANAPTQAVNAGGITWDDLIDIQAIVNRNVLSNSVYVFNRRTWNSVKKLKDSTGRPLVDTADKTVLQNLNVAGGNGLVAVGYIDIFPVYVADDLVIPKGIGNAVSGDKVGFFGDIKRAGVLVIKKGFNIVKDTDLKTDEVSFIGSMRKRFDTKLDEAYGVFEVA